MALVSAEILYFCFGCLFWTSACLEITYSSSSEMVDGDSFKTGSRVNFTCTHQSYQGIQIWTFDTMKLLDCGLVACDIFTSDDRFSFSEDINNGIFIFTIKHVELSDDGKIIKCGDGSVNKTFEIKVKGFITTSPFSTKSNAKTTISSVNNTTSTGDITTSTLSTKSSTNLIFSTIRNRNSTASFQRKHDIYIYVACGVAGTGIVVLIMVYIYRRRRNLS